MRILIQTNQGPAATDARLCAANDKLAVHRTVYADEKNKLGLFTVTHVPTGRALGSHDNEGVCFDVVSLIADLDWDFTADDVLDTKKWNDIQRRLTSAKNILSENGFTIDGFASRRIDE